MPAEVLIASACVTCAANCRAWLRQGAGLLLAAAWPALALALDKPAGTVLLTLRGRVRNPNHGVQAHFGRPMLQGLPQTSFTTSTPWDAQPRRFTGPLLRDVLGAAGCQGQTLRLIAPNVEVI